MEGRIAGTVGSVAGEATVIVADERASQLLREASIDWMRVGLITLFSVICLRRFVFLALNGAFFSEPNIDVLAARTWLAGGDPWLVTGPGGIRFGGPPTMLLPYAPFTLLDPLVARALLAAIGVAAAVAALRRLQMPLWWLLWPPLFEAVVHASFDGLIPLLLIAAPPLAALVKPYSASALSPRGLLLTTVLVVATLLILPWVMFLRDVPMIAETLRTQAASGGLSVWGNPAAMTVVGLVLAVTWRRTKLVAPAALWPLAQFHYGSMALSVAGRSRVLAAFMAVPVPGAAALGLLLYAGGVRYVLSLVNLVRVRVGTRQ